MPVSSDCLVSCEELEKVVIEEDEERYFQVETLLPSEDKRQLVDFLKKILDIFAWSVYEAPGVDPEFICHQLNVNPKATLRKQPYRRSSKEHVEVVKEEVQKLKQVREIKEVFYPEWLANTVVVRKKSRKWRVCVDFTNLNKTCPKDPFHVPRIDQIVDVTFGYPRMSFLDAF